MHQNTSCTLCLAYLLQGQFVSFSFCFSMFKHVFIAQPNMSRQLCYLFTILWKYDTSLLQWDLLEFWIANHLPTLWLDLAIKISATYRETLVVFLILPPVPIWKYPISRKNLTLKNIFFHWRITPSITNNIHLSFCFLMKIHFIYSFNCLANLMPPRKFNCPHSVIGAEKNNHLLFSTDIWTFEQVC